MADPISPTGNLGRGSSGPLVELQAVESTRVSQASGQTPPTASTPRAKELLEPGKDDREGQGLVPTLAEEEKALNSLRDDLKLTPSQLSIHRDEEIGRIIFKIVNAKTGEVLRQVPSEELLTVARKLRQLSESGAQPAGVLVDEKG